MSLQKVKISLDPNTGVFTGFEAERFKKVYAEEFMQVYLEDMAGIMQISTKSELHVLMWMWKMSSYLADKENDLGNQIDMNKTNREYICNKVGITDGSVKNILNSLVAKNLLLVRKGYRGVYYLNPNYFFKGGLKDRKSVTSYKQINNYEIIENIEFLKQVE